MGSQSVIKSIKRDGNLGKGDTESLIKDCRSAFLEGICLISAANSAVNLMHREAGIILNRQEAGKNADLIIRGGRQYLRAIKDISPHEEILIGYSSSFKF
jgi:hypothetical protein